MKKQKKLTTDQLIGQIFEKGLSFDKLSKLVEEGIEAGILDKIPTEDFKTQQLKKMNEFAVVLTTLTDDEIGTIEIQKAISDFTDLLINYFGDSGTDLIFKVLNNIRFKKFNDLEVAEIEKKSN